MIKIITLNGKKIGVTLIIIGLMLMLIVFEKNFDHRLKFAALMHSNINSLKEYSILDNKYTYKLPEEWKTKKRQFQGKEIIYHNEFASKDNNIYGFVQVWNINKSLKKFLEDSKQIALEQNVINDYKIEQFNVNNEKGYLVTYSLVDGKNYTYNSYEYFIKREEGFLRFSFFVRKENFKENMPTIFQTIVNTLKII
ncbi:hypothetical protein ACFIJ5_16765 [Haloimpatiens sp. FM7330]|uniref:hypothetical protein n=1 Tax=Haloimpatiens sp. FM7330 TaxID=3298610 RepID=UPI0036386702